MSIRQRAEEALKRSAAATSGRAEDGIWEIEREELDAEDFTDGEQALAFPQSIGPIATWEPQNIYEPAQNEADARFIAEARADVPDFAAALLRLTGLEMREQILCVRAIGEDQADAIMALLLAAAEGTP